MALLSPAMIAEIQEIARKYVASEEAAKRDQQQSESEKDSEPETPG